MERKRRLPARAAARAEKVAKRRNVTPREPTPVPTPPPEEPSPEPTPPLELPTSIQADQPLPTIDDAQPEDLSAEDYQSITESGVLAESLVRSRHKWINEGLFEKFWTKPHKRKGVVHEDPKNPPKDSMTKVGHVTISIEPHLIDATMYVVKAPKPPPGQQPQPTPQQSQKQQSPAASQSQAAAPANALPPTRPIIQYGPPNGAMPPPPTPPSGPATPSTPVAATNQLQAATSGGVAPRAPQMSGQDGTTPGAPVKLESPQPPKPAVAATPATKPIASPGPGKGPTVPPAGLATGAATAPKIQPQPSKSGLSMPPGLGANNPPVAAPPSVTRPSGPVAPSSSAAPAKPAASAPKPAASDPVIALLAQKASGDPKLRDLMKRVAMGQAEPGELAHFQKIIDQLNTEYKKSISQQGPPADKLFVDRKSVQYFADEVRTILDIVLASNPNQKSSELRPPPGSDPLVVLLVKTALEDQRTRDIIRRIADHRPGPQDSQHLKEILDRLHRDTKTVSQSMTQAAQPRPPVANGQSQLQPMAPAQPNPQALRSKGPPPAPKPEITAVVLDFGTGDRYLFPKYSILEYTEAPVGQQVVASFLIVRKGSISEYGGDPKLDYYQPVTIRFQTQSGKALENLARVVAPPEEVRRYMDDVMDNMTRAEYLLLAMRLPRVHKEEAREETETPKTNGASTSVEPSADSKPVSVKPGVLWTTPATVSASPDHRPVKVPDPEEETELRYQRLIQSVAAKDAVPV